MTAASAGASGLAVSFAVVARPREPLIFRDDVFEVALQLIDQDGIDKFSMRTLGSALGVNAASLYHHFKDKDEILNGVARVALSRYQAPPVDERRDWIEQIVGLVLGAFRSLQDHPNIVPVLTRRSDRDFAIVVHERVARLLVEGGVPGHLVVPLLDTLEGLLIGTAVLESAASSAVGYSINAERFPVLSSALAGDPLQPDRRLEIAVRSLLRGWVVGAVALESTRRSSAKAPARRSRRKGVTT